MCCGLSHAIVMSKFRQGILKINYTVMVQVLVKDCSASVKYLPVERMILAFTTSITFILQSFDVVGSATSSVATFPKSLLLGSA